MNATVLRSFGIVAVFFMLVVGVAAPLPAQELAVLHAQSLGDVFDGIERVSQAVGQPIARQQLMGMASGMFGIDPGEFLDFGRPVAVALPVQGMMLQQNGLVAAVPVSNADAAFAALEKLFDGHTVEGDLHVFSRADTPMLYLTLSEGYLRVGGSRDLVAGFDPLAGGDPKTDLSLEIFLEPVAPMISAGLQGAKEQVKLGFENEIADDAAAAGEEVPIDPDAMAPLFDFYFDGVQSLLANASSIRLALDFEEEDVLFHKTLVAKQDSPLARFFAAQKAGVPATAGVADPHAAFYLAGTMSFEDEHRAWLKQFADRYMEVATTIFDSMAAGGDGDDGAKTGMPDMQLWKDYMNAMAGFSDRWVDCWRGDMAVSFDLSVGKPFSFVEVFGLNPGAGCRGLLGEMSEQIEDLVEGNPDLAAVFTVADGPRVGGAASTLLELDMAAMAAASGEPMDAEAAKVIETLYGEKLVIAMATLGDNALAVGGADAGDRLRGAVSKLAGPAKAPSFAPLKKGPGMSMIINIGRFLDGLASALPEGELDLDGPVGALRGEAGRIPMGLKFGPDSATFELALPMKTIEAIAAIAEHERAEAAAAAASEAETVGTEGE